MSRLTHAQGGRVPRLPGVKGNRKPLLLQSPEHTPTTVGAFGTDVLNITNVSTKLRQFHPETLKEILKNGSAERLVRCAENMAKQYGFELETQKLRNTKDVLRLLNELKEKAHENVRVYEDSDRILRLVHGSIVSDDWETYFIPIADTYKMAPATGLFARRCIRTIQKAFQLDDLTRQTYYEWAMDIMKCNEEEAQANPEMFDPEDIKKISIYKEYVEGGKAYQGLRSLDKVKPLSIKEIQAFTPSSTAEAKLKDSMLEMYEIIETKINIWEWISSENPFLSDEDTDYETIEYVPFASICTVIWDFDPLVEEYISLCNYNVESGAICEVLANIKEIPLEGSIDNINVLKEFIERLKLFIDALLNEELIITKDNVKKDTETRRQAA